MAVVGLGSVGVVLGLTSTVQANELCGSSDPTVVCCNGQAVRGAMPTLSDAFAQDVCQLLTMPTASRSEGENFTRQVKPGSLVTNTSVSADAMTLPSMWWTRDSLPPQLGRHRLVDSWIAYTINDSDVRVVDVMISSQFWRALTMPQRYGVLSKFGNSAQDFGYSLRFFQSNGYSARMIGFYSCEATLNGELDASSVNGGPNHCLVSVDTPRLVQLQRAAASEPTIQTAQEPSTSVDVAEVLGSQTP